MPDTLAEKLYYRLPISLQNGLFTIYGWNVARKRYNCHFYEHLDRLKESEWWSSDEIKAYQDKHAAQIVKHAYFTTTFYRQWYDDHNVDVSAVKAVEDLIALPILTKDLVKKNYKTMISSSVANRSLIKTLTSGTTGTPLIVYQTAETMAYQWAIWWRHKARFGLSPRDRHLTFGARVPIPQNQSQPPFWRHDYANNRVYLSTYHISKRTVRDILDFLNETSFDFFTGYPSAMYFFADLIESSGLTLEKRPKYVVSGSDALTPIYESVISRVFGAPVTEQYGMTEFAGNMSKCEDGNFHTDFECCVIEQSPTDSTGFTELLLTGWGNPVMPFIRYQIGDYGRSIDGRCSCGRMSRCFTSIDGRLEDYVVTPDGRKLIGMNQVFEYAKHAKAMQLYQDSPNEVEFRIIPMAGFGDVDKDALLREFRRRGGDDIAVRFVLVDNLQNSSSGKVRSVISKIGQ